MEAVRDRQLLRLIWDAEIHLSDYGLTIEAEEGLAKDVRDALCDEAALRGRSVWETVTAIIRDWFKEQQQC